MRKLEEILKYDQPTKFIVNSDDYNDEFEIPVLTAGKTFLLGFTSETEGVFDRIPAIIFDDFTTSFHYVDFPFKVKSSAMKILTPKTDKVHLKYVFYQMQGLRIDTDLHKRYWISKFSKLQIPQPPLKTQKLIAEILDNAGALRDKTKQLLTEYDRLVQSIFLDMFGDTKKNPKLWKEDFLENLCTDIIDCPHSTPNYVDETTDYPCIRTTELKKGEIDWSKMKYLDEEGYKLRTKRLVPKSGDIIYGREGTFGEAVLVPKNTLMSLGQRVILFRPKHHKINNLFLLHVIRSKGVYHQALRVNAGSTVGHVNVKDIKKFRIFIPPLPIQTQFAEKINLIDRQKELAKKELRESEDLFKALLQKAFKGELVKEKELEIN
jgi:type I restriction enzyme S subunit